MSDPPELNRGLILGALITRGLHRPPTSPRSEGRLTFALVDPGGGDLDGRPALYFSGANILENNMVQTQACGWLCLDHLSFPALLMTGY